MPQNQADIDGVFTFEGFNFGGFQTFTGAEESGEVVEDRQPGAQYADKDVVNPGITNITMTRSWVEARDRSLYNRLKGRVGKKGAAGKIVRDENKNISDVESFSVKLARFAGGDGDTNGGTAKALFTVELVVTGRA